MKNWFLNLTERDKKIVGTLGVAISLLLSYTFLWMPLSNDNHQLEKRIKRLQADRAWMQESAEKIKAMGPQKSHNTTAKKSSSSMLTSIEKTAAQQGITLKKITPKKNKQVEIRLIDVPFNPVIHWLFALKSEQGILTSKFSAEKTTSGRVNLTLLLEG